MSKDAFHHLTSGEDHVVPKVRHKMQIPIAKDPLQLAVRALLDPDDQPATLRDLVASMLHAAAVARAKAWPDGPDADPMKAARFAWRETEAFFEARKEAQAARGKGRR